MNFVQAIEAVETEDEKRRDDARKLRLKARDIYRQLLENLEGSGLTRHGGDHETEETIEASLFVSNTFPQHYIRVIAHDVGAVILQRRDQTGRQIRPTESGDTVESAMKALVRLSRD